MQTIFMDQVHLKKHMILYIILKKTIFRFQQYPILLKIHFQKMEEFREVYALKMEIN